jgi:ADP-dependent NAD(P)H-hydrate dehydratase / NAD(P)H-hydrate epimerase
MKCVNVNQMRELDRRTIEEFGTPGEVLMERAGTRAAEVILAWSANLPPQHVKRFICLAGKGNNGGDAYVVARYIYENTDLEVILYSVCAVEALQGDALHHAKLLPKEVDLEVKDQLNTEDFKSGDIIIDGLLGTGISGPLRAPYSQWIATVNTARLPTAALDIPSGMNGDDGTIASDCILADLTVTIGLPKYGLVKNQGPDYCGQLRLVEIGIPEEYITETTSNLDMTFPPDVQRFLVRVPMQSYKNIVGNVLICGGCAEYRGAPLLAAESALRGGAGMVYLLTAGGNRMLTGPKALIYRYLDIPYLDERAASAMIEMSEDTDVIVCGPGMGREAGSDRFIQACGSTGKTVVYDADALAIIARNFSLLVNNGTPILTPHPGEMRMLLDGFDLEYLKQESLLKQVTSLARISQAIIVLKGRNTLIAHPNGRLAVNSSGSPALAGAGSGDCLAGLIGAFAASPQGRKNIFEAICAAVFVHGLAGELNPHGIRGAIADDLPLLIPEAMRHITALA